MDVPPDKTFSLIVGSCLQLYGYLVEMPDVADILLDGAVRSELAGFCDIENSHACPAVLVAVRFLDALLCSFVGAEVLEDEILVGALAAVAVEKRVVQLAELLRILRRIERSFALS